MVIKQYNKRFREDRLGSNGTNGDWQSSGAKKGYQVAVPWFLRPQGSARSNTSGSEDGTGACPTRVSQGSRRQLEVMERMEVTIRARCTNITPASNDWRDSDETDASDVPSFLSCLGSAY